MDNQVHISFAAEDRSYLAIIKKQIHTLASEAGFTKNKVAEIDIVVAEMLSNLIKHAGGGELLVKCTSEDDNEILELISVDNGSGITEPQKMVEDGMSTTNTLGQGLGAIKRLSDVFQIYSLPEWGTIVLSRIYKNPVGHYQKKSSAEVRCIVVAKPGEEQSGDGAYYTAQREYLKIFLGDGLGHGPEAHKAVQKAISTFKASKENDPKELLREINKDVKRTRGLVGATAIYKFSDKKWRICGIGNIATRMHAIATTKSYMAYNGIIGLNIPTTLKEHEISNERGQVIIMCSDGIRTKWDMAKYTGILRYDLSILAAAIYKDHSRKTDDMSVVVGRVNTML